MPTGGSSTGGVTTVPPAAIACQESTVAAFPLATKYTSCLPVRSDVSFAPISLKSLIDVTFKDAIGVPFTPSIYTSMAVLGAFDLALTKIPAIPFEKSTFFASI